MMKLAKSVAALWLSISMALSLLCIPSQASGDIAVMVNGSRVEFDTPPYLEQDRVLVPFRAIAEAIGVTVEWNEEDERIIGYLDRADSSENVTQAYVQMQIGSNEATVDQQKFTIDVAPALKDGRTFVPLRFFAEAFGAKVEWYDDTQTAEIEIAPLFEAELAQTCDLLPGRLTLSQPDGSQCTVSTNNSTQISTPKIYGDQLMVTAEELYYLSTGDLKKDLEYLGYNAAGEIMVQNGVELLRYTMPSRNPPTWGLPMASAPMPDAMMDCGRFIIKSHDGMLIRLTFQAPWDSLSYMRNEYQDLIDRILPSVAAGKRELDREAHEETLRGNTIELPASYAAYSIENGLTIRQIVEVTDKEDASYLEFYLNTARDGSSLGETREDKTLSKTVKSHLYGEYDLEWKIYSDGTMEAYYAGEEILSGLYDFYGFAKSSAQQNKLIQMVESIRRYYPAGAKPVIYLYPETETEVQVELSLSGEFTFTYPEYKNGWKVTARPDGTILSDGLEYSYLFWEGTLPGLEPDFKEGFVVKGEDSAAFLRQVLSEMGLTPREYNEFIVYWAPKLQGNEYNKIYFAGQEYEEAAKLSITPEPDSLLRVFMIYEPAEADTVLAPQKIEPFERKGFTVVEWGGSPVNTK